MLLKPTLSRTVRGSGAILAAMIFTHYFSKTQSYWLTVIAALLAQSELGFPLQQGLQRFLWIIFLFFVGAQLDLFVASAGGLPFLLIAITTLLAYRYASYPHRYGGLPFSLLGLIVLLLTLLMPAPFFNAAYLQDIFMGAALGLGSTVLIFPDKPDLEFPKRITPLLRDLSDYLAALIDLVLQENESAQRLEYKRAAVEKCWTNKEEAFPIWVFEAGFNPALKPGQYYFVVHVGQITEILFAMHHYARHPFPKELLTEFKTVIRDSAERSQELLTNLVILLEGKKLSFSQTDFMSDLPALDECFQSKIKLSLELLDISRDYVYLAAFIRYLKDLRLQLLQLAATLR